MQDVAKRPAKRKPPANLGTKRVPNEKETAGDPDVVARKFAAAARLALEMSLEPKLRRKGKDLSQALHAALEEVLQMKGAPPQEWRCDPDGFARLAVDLVRAANLLAGAISTPREATASTSALLPALQAQLALAATVWNRASLAHPGHDTILHVNRILGALDVALNIGDAEFIAGLHDGSRAFLRSYKLDTRYKTLGEQALGIAKRIEAVVVANKRDQDVQGTTELFLSELEWEGEPIARKLAKAGIVINRLSPGSRTRRDLLPEVVAKVQAVFTKELFTHRHDDNGLGKRLVQKALESLGFPDARSLFSAAAKREARVADSLGVGFEARAIP